MRRLFPFANILSRLFGESKGSISVVFGLMLIPTTIAIGAGVDFSRALQLKSQMQSAADAAALAGASAYKDATSGSLATTTATNYMKSAITNMTTNLGVTYTTVPTTKAISGSTTGYIMTVTASSQLKPTLLGLFVSGINVSVSAQAENPIVTATVNLANFSSSACDANTIYYYYVPSDGSTPANSDLVQLYTNTSTTNVKNVSFQISASKQIGFVLKNVTGGQCGYGTNGYGGKQGSTHYFYSQYNPPSQIAYPTTTKNCALQVLSVPSSGKLPTPATGSCYTAAFVGAAPSCSQLSGQSFEYAWNDMGGTSDDYDYNDAVYSFSCSATDSTNAVVFLTQ